MAKKLKKGINPPIRKDRTAAKVKGGNKTSKGGVFGKWMPNRRVRKVRSA